MKLTIFGAAMLYACLAVAQPKNFIDQPYVEISGTADSLVTPNRIYIRVTLSEKDSKNKQSIEEMEAKMIDLFKSLGIKTETDLTTSDILSHYQYYLLRKKDIIKTKQYILKVSDAFLATKVFIGLEELEISNVMIERVDHTNLEAIRNICRLNAIRQAKSKATALSQTIGQAIGPALYISDSESQFTSELSGKGAAVVVTGYAIRKAASYEDLKVDFEKIHISCTVNTRFALK